MSSTLDKMTVRPPSSPPPSPSPVRDVDLQDVAGLVSNQGNTLEEHDYVSRSSRDAGRPTYQAIVIEQDEDGCVIASDLLGAVYGAGPSEGEALAHFDRALDDHLAFLRAHIDELHPRLERQLAGLQRLFPGR